MPDDPQKKDADLGGNYARDPHREGFGDDYARDDEDERAAGQDNAADEIRIGKTSE